MVTHESNPNPELKYCFTCGICEKKFTRKQTLKAHVLSHAKNSHLKYSHACNLCHRKYTQRRILQVHIKSVHKTNPN